MKAQAGRGSTGGRSKASYDLPKFDGSKKKPAAKKAATKKFVNIELPNRKPKPAKRGR